MQAGAWRICMDIVASGVWWPHSFQNATPLEPRVLGGGTIVHRRVKLSHSENRSIQGPGDGAPRAGKLVGHPRVYYACTSRVLRVYSRGDLAPRADSEGSYMFTYIYIYIYRVHVDPGSLSNTRHPLPHLHKDTQLNSRKQANCNCYMQFQQNRNMFT